MSLESGHCGGPPRPPVESAEASGEQQECRPGKGGHVTEKIHIYQAPTHTWHIHYRLGLCLCVPAI